jgi:ABC-type transport system involved in multi-copper enzyme maturation permease subunit
MTRLARLWQLSLLIKELTELAARRRTYVVRLIYAGLLFVVACVLFYGGLSSSGTASILGQGRPKFVQLVTLQLWGIYLLLPAMVCGVITSEKERDSLSLLMLTSLSPMQIIVQKLFSRLVPMFSFLFVSFPLMAIAYSQGGVTPGYLWSGILLLALTCLQVGSFSVACSAFFRTTHEAFAASYFGLLSLFLILPGAFAPEVFELADRLTFGQTVSHSSMIVVSTACFFFLAHLFLKTRAFVPPRNYLLEVFTALDRMFMDMNHVTGGIMLTRDVQLLPKTKPVAWREMSKKSLGTTRYLFRVLVVLELPLLCVFQLLNGPGASTSPNSVTVLLYLLWGISVALVAVHAAGLVSSERSRQTLDVLLTTPISGREIILQKFRGVRRLIWVLLVPFLSIFAFERWFKISHGWEYFCWSTVFVLIYLPLTAWFSMWLGLQFRSQLRATAAAVCLIVAWMTLPHGIQYLLVSGFDVQFPDGAQYLLLLSPAVVIPAIESANPSAHGIPDPYWTFYLVNIALYGTLLWMFRRLSLKDADTRLGRAKITGRNLVATEHRAEGDRLGTSPVS